MLVTDSEKALFLENVTDGADVHLKVVTKKTQDNPSDAAQSANRPGRMNDNGVGQRSALEDTDWHELAKERFAAELSDLLYERAHEGDFSKLVLVASPQILGELRENLHVTVTDKIIGEVDKTLSNHPIDEIEKIVVKALAN